MASSTSVVNNNHPEWLRLAPEHQRLFDFAFEHFSGGKWQRRHHAKLLQQKLLQANGGAVRNAQGEAQSASVRAGVLRSTHVASEGPVDDDDPIIGFSALSNLLLGMGCMIGSSDELIVAIDALPSARSHLTGIREKESGRQKEQVATRPSEVFLSYNESLELAASLPTVLPRWVRCSPYSSSPSPSARNVTSTATSSSTSPGRVDMEEEAFNANLPQIMEAIRLFVMFQKDHVLSLQALRTILSTTGDEPLSQGELDYLLHPLHASSSTPHTKRGGGAQSNERAVDSVTLLQLLQLFKLV